MAERSPIQTAAILICLTGEKGDNLPPQPLTRGRGGGVRKQGAKAKSKGRRAELNSDKAVGERESEKERKEHGGKESVIFDYGSRLVCLSKG